MKIASKNPLNIIIVGCGNVGTTLVGELSKEGNNVTVIDRTGNPFPL
jgi:2-polyprenyl-6-methoxyphenol hydroxylase and related FAD-dependent oxidoreductases